MKFKREDGAFDVERFKAAVRIFITAQEIVIDNGDEETATDRVSGREARTAKGIARSLE